MNDKRMARSIVATMIMLALVALGISVWISMRERAVDRIPDVVTTQEQEK